MAEHNIWQRELHDQHHRLAETLGIPPTGPHTMDWDGLIEVVRNLRFADRADQQEPAVFVQRDEEGHRYDEQMRFRCLEAAMEIEYADPNTMTLKDSVKEALDCAAEIYAFIRGAPPPGAAPSKPVSVHVVGES